MVKAIGVAATLGSVSGLAGAQDDGEQDEPDYGDWFDDVDNYEETEDLTDEDEVTVEVGAGDQGFRFEPPAIRVSPETTVVWEWTGEGGRHNVVHVPEAEPNGEDDEDEDPEFESELEEEEGFTFEHEFEEEEDEERVYPYVCEPHESVGMKGAVVVGEGE